MDILLKLFGLDVQVILRRAIFSKQLNGHFIDVYVSVLSSKDRPDQKFKGVGVDSWTCASG